MHPNVRLDAVYKQAKYFQGQGKYEAMLYIAQTARSFCTPICGISYHALYFRLTCAAACYALNRVEEAK